MQHTPFVSSVTIYRCRSPVVNIDEGDLIIFNLEPYQLCIKIINQTWFFMNLHFSHVYCHFSKHNSIDVVELFIIIFDQRIKEMIKNKIEHPMEISTFMIILEPTLIASLLLLLF